MICRVCGGYSTGPLCHYCGTEKAKAARSDDPHYILAEMRETLQTMNKILKEEGSI